MQYTDINISKLTSQKLLGSIAVRQNTVYSEHKTGNQKEKKSILKYCLYTEECREVVTKG